LAEHFGTKIKVYKDRFMKLKTFGMGENHFVTKQNYNKQRDGQIFIHLKNMRDLPNTVEDIEQKKDVVHVVLTGWKGRYNLKHSRYLKIAYSSHSSE
jgi:hypothetical protein